MGASSSRGVVAEPGASVFVWTVWALSLLAALALIAAYGVNVPLWDDYALVPILTGREPLTLKWLWSQHFEHRLVLPRLVLLGVDRLTGDLRAGMVLNVLALGTVAAVLMVAARRLRGEWSFSDAFLPLVLMGVGHHVNLLRHWQFQFISSTALACLILRFILMEPERRGPGTTLAVGLGLVLLTLTGANGLALVPALAAWLVVSVGLRRTGGVRGLLAATVPAAVALALTLLYFRGFRRASAFPPTRGVVETLRTSLQFLSTGLGPAMKAIWPWSGLATLSLIVSVAIVLVRAWLLRADDRVRVEGLLLSLAGLLCLALGLGWGRNGMGADAGFEERYVTLSAPVFVIAYFAWLLYAPGPLRALGQMTLLLAPVALLWPNVEKARAWGRDDSAKVASFLRDLNAGVPAYVLVRRHAEDLGATQETLYQSLTMLHRAGFGPFRSLREDAPFREVTLPVRPSELSLVRWEPPTAHLTGVDPYLSFELPEARYLAGVRITCSYEDRPGLPARFQMYWSGPGPFVASESRHFADWSMPRGVRRVETIWICDVVKRFRIQPDNRPGAFTIDEIRLLIPPG